VAEAEEAGLARESDRVTRELAGVSAASAELEALATELQPLSQIAEEFQRYERLAREEGRRQTLVETERSLSDELTRLRERRARVFNAPILEEEATIDHPAHETVAGFLDAVQGRTPSWTWRVPEERLNAALDVGRRWTVERYGTTDIRLEERVRQRWWVFEVS